MQKITLLLVLFSALITGTAAADSRNSAAMSFTAGLELVAEGFTSPIYMVEAPDGSGRLFVVDQIGVIRIISAEGQLLDTPFLNVQARLVTLMPNFDERGLLGLAFHPDYANNGRFFVYYSAPLRPGAPADYDHTATIAQFLVSADPNLADPTSETILLQVDKPQFNHNGGTLMFGPDDGYLYISIGDGGGANDVGLGHVEDWYADNAGGNGQDVEQNLLGNILRIDVGGPAPYGIPADNPFAGRDGLDEIYAYGFRNPYRFSFDMGGSHRLFVGDAGQDLWEEVSIVNKGGNYGWNVKEGTHCFDAENPGVSPADCPATVGPGHPDSGVPLIDPIIEYANANQPGGLGFTVIGGYVYRGDDIPPFRGRYIFGDWSRSFSTPDGSVFLAQSRQGGLWLIREVRFFGQPDGRLGHFLLAFAQDSTGEMYLLTSDVVGPSGNTGRIYQLVKPDRSG